ncbi:TPA: hypothetical protein DCX16_01410 [bacterium]|nr:hypothetical protein [bacterium]
MVKKVFILPIIFYSVSFAIEIEPYYNWALSQGYSWGKDIEPSFGNNILNDIGCQVKLGDKDSLLLLYEASYEGPGIKEKKKFTDRSQEHLFLVSWTKRLNIMTLKTRLDYLKSFTRSGVSESWETGDYNFNRLGFGCDVLTLLYKTGIKGGFRFADVKYPNYTYLLGEIDPNYDLPRYDNRRYRLSLSVKPGFHPMVKPDITSNLHFIRYKNEFIKDINSGSDTGEREKDSIYEFGLSIPCQLKENVAIGMDSLFSFLRSNYNEVKFSSLGTVASACKSFYDYNLYEFSPYISTKLKNMVFSLSYSHKIKNFTDQPPEDSSRNWLSSKRRDKNTTILLSLKKPINKALSLTLSYGMIKLSSNSQRTGLNVSYNQLGITTSFEY